MRNELADTVDGSRASARGLHHPEPKAVSDAEFG
jgi:hypothetical protein